MRTLLEDGIDKAARGLTTLDEVLRVVSPGDADQPGGQRTSRTSCRGGDDRTGAGGGAEPDRLEPADGCWSSKTAPRSWRW